MKRLLVRQQKHSDRAWTLRQWVTKARQKGLVRSILVQRSECRRHAGNRFEKGVMDCGWLTRSSSSHVRAPFTSVYLTHVSVPAVAQSRARENCLQQRRKEKRLANIPPRWSGTIEGRSACLHRQPPHGTTSPRIGRDCAADAWTKN